MRVGEKFCPGVLNAVDAKDGLLLRIRIPGGLIAASQLRTLSELSADFADGEIEITSRANIQLRAVRPENLSRIRTCLKIAGLFPSETHDRIRNLVTSPLTGLDRSEHIDCRPLLRELDNRLLADTRLVELHPKFSFEIDGGGRRFSRDTNDISLQAVVGQDGPYFLFFLGDRDTGFGVNPKDAVDCMLEAAVACLRFAREYEVPVRGKSVMAVTGARDIVARQLARFLIPAAVVERAVEIVEAPIGEYPSREANRVNLIPSVPLGRVTALQADCVARMAIDSGADLRLAPWRGIVLGSVPSDLIGHLTSELNAAGLHLDGRDGRRGIAVCAGLTGCDASMADVRKDANTLATHLRGRDVMPGWSVNLSGCEKRCAMRHGAVVDVVADSSGYMVKIGEDIAVRHGSAMSMIEASLAAHAGMSREVQA